MDAHLIGIDLAQFLLKQNARREKQAPFKVKSDAESATAAKETRHRIFAEHIARRESTMTKGRTVLGLLIGFGVGVGLTLLFAPQSGEDTRYWIALTSRRARRRLRNTSRRSIEQVRDMLERGQESVSKAIHSRGNSAETEVTEL